MARDPRDRSRWHHVTADEGPRRIEWASEKQAEVFRYGPFPLCASGGFGSAKTWALCLKALWLSTTFQCNRGVIARKEYELLKNTTMTTFFKICPPDLYREGKRSDSEKYLRLNNGSEILWMHMDDPETENVIRGLEINWFILDQAEEIDEEIFDLLMTRLGRWDKAEVPGEMVEKEGGIEEWAWRNPVTGTALVPTYPMIACNPDTELHWIWRRFHPDSHEWREKYRDQGYRMWVMRSDENRFLPKQNLDLMLAKDESFVRRFVRGEWGIPEGCIHDVSPLSVVKAGLDFVEYLKQFCTLHRTLDHGDSSPTCCLWWAVDPQGNVFCYREYYAANRLISEHRREIAALSAGEHYQFQLADPSIFYLTSQKYGGRWSVADEYSDCKFLPRHTAIWWDKADNNELGTRNRISEYLRVDPNRVNPVTKERGSPRLFFIERSDGYPQGCFHAIRELRSQRRRKIGTEGGRPVFDDQREESVPDHGYDCTRYLLASRPPVSMEIDKKYGAGSFYATRERLKRFRKRGGFRMLADEAAKRYEGRV